MIPYTSIPLISACFLVMVGVLIGHLIWNRYRDEQQEKAADLQREIDELQSSLSVQANDTADARLKMHEVEEVLASEREAVTELQARMASNESLYESAAADLEKSEQVNLQLREQLVQQDQELGKFRAYAEQAASTISQFESQLNQKSAEAADELQTVRVQLDAANEAHEALGQQLVMRDARIVELEDSQRTWQGHAATADAEVTRLTDLLQRQETRLTAQANELSNASSLREERDQLQAALNQTESQMDLLRSESTSSIKQLRDQVAGLSERNVELKQSKQDYERQLAAQIQLSDDLSSKIETALADLGRLNERAAELQTVRLDRDRLIDELDERQDQIKQLAGELDRVSTAELQGQQQLQQLRQQCDELQTQLHEWTTEREKTTDELRRADERRESLERSLAAASEEVAQLHIERERLEGIEDEVVELHAKRRELAQGLELANRERAQALAAESSTREIVVELRDELSDRLESVQLLEDQRNDAVAEVEQERSKHEAMRAEVVAANQTIDSLQQRQQTAQQQHKESVAELERLKGELQTAKNLYSQVAEQVTMYRQDAQQSRTDTASPPRKSVSGEKAERRSRSNRRAKSAFSFRKAQRREEDVRAREKANTRRDKRLGMVYTMAPLRCDDLTEIQGIDEQLQRKLNSLGVYTYKQVMEWNSQVTAAFTDQLATDGILKDDWSGQARRLYHRNYPAAA